MGGSRDWIRRAACGGMDADVFYPYASNPDAYEPAKGVCRDCPVRAMCLEYALDNDEQYEDVGRHGSGGAAPAQTARHETASHARLPSRERRHMRFHVEEHRYFTLVERLEGAPDGVEATIIRISPRLSAFVTVKVPFAYRLPAGTLEPDCVQVRDHTVVHGSFMETADAEAWAIGYVEGLKPCPHPKGGRQ